MATGDESSDDCDGIDVGTGVGTDTGDGGASTPVDRRRRRLLKLVGGGTVGAVVGRVVYELLGYGTVTGTNVTRQRLDGAVRRHLEPSGFDISVSGYRLAFDGDAVEVRDDAGTRLTTVSVADADAGEAARRGAEYGLETPLGNLAADLDALAGGGVAVEVSDYRSFFARLREANTRPTTVAALRGGRYRRPDTEALEAFTDSDPRDPRALVTGLAAGFRDRTHFDATRYVVGNVQDHLLRETVRLRQRLEAPTTFDALDEGDVGMYCWEYTLRAIEAFHALDPHRQSVPVFGAIVRDRRHNHVYTALGSAVRDDGGLRIPLTLLDYSHATMYDTYRLRWALGDGVDAYDGRHRVTDVHYRNLYAFSY